MIKTDFFRDRLPNVAPYCDVLTPGWTGSVTGEVITTITTATSTQVIGNISLSPVNPLNSFVLHYTLGGTSYSITADATGRFADDNINGGILLDGTYLINIVNMPDVGTNIVCDYSYGMPPTNLKNALDINNPNPSDWGGKTTTGSGSIGSLLIKFPENGIYLVDMIYEQSSTGSGGVLVNAFHRDVVGNWHFYANVSTYTIKTYGYRRYTIPCIFKKDNYWDNCILEFRTLNADTFHVRIWNIFVFKLA